MFSLAMSTLHSHALAGKTVRDRLLSLRKICKKCPMFRVKKLKHLSLSWLKVRNNLEFEHHNDIEPLEDYDFILYRMLDEIVTDFGYKSIAQAIKELNSVYRDIMVIKYVLEKSTNDLSELLQIQLRTVESCLYRGRKKLKEKLEGTLDEQRV